MTPMCGVRLSKYFIQFALTYLVLKINLCQSQFIDFQYFTPALSIINGPQPDQNIDAGQNLQFSLEVSGNGKLPPASLEPGNQQATTILSLSVFLINADLNMTIFENLNLLELERGSSVKHYDFQLPSCTPSGTYQLKYEMSDIYWSVIIFLRSHIMRLGSPLLCCSPLSKLNSDINVNNPDGHSSKTCQGATPPKDKPQDSKPPAQPFLGKGTTGLDIKTDSMEAPTAAPVDVPAAKPVDVPVAKPVDAPVAEFAEGLLSHDIVNRATAADLGVLQAKSDSQTSATTPKAVPFSQFKIENVKKAPLAVTLVSEAPSTKEETPSAEGLAVAEALTKNSSPSSDGSKAKFSSLGNQKFTKSVADARQKASSSANHQGSNDKNSDPQSNIHDPLSNQKTSHETQNHEQTLSPNHSQSVFSNKSSKDGKLFGVPLISSASSSTSIVTNHRTLYHLLIFLCLISLSL
ncbi:uncharacterized protein MELLADRAFT_112382 [Melampsora larici-populina 98AG31]|uniref:Uncharacterized protein n=1 Tax=Melampsora larici-populina (strain 98AG31 / pathotype 3-4-7) TaxID=747676 RepID=F4S6A9_MELLP|nr:uncharacterized protein MELLADRAFT_112382 [Melampsora larici-populina 98AG31]EGF99831.1 hypothetical protein MELLADRAFT_112382 [Melampsora larici-populina 98AG31]